MKMTRGLRPLYWTLVHLIDDGQAASLDQVSAHIDAGDTIAWLTELAGEWEATWGVLALVRGDSESMASVQDFLERHQNAVEAGDVAVKKNGLCLLLGYCLNELQSAFV